MTPGSSWRERSMTGRDARPPIGTDPDEEALAAALSRHETALARLRQSLPSPPKAVVLELEAAERALRAILALRDSEAR